MQTAVGGIHHVTMIAGSAQRNLDFYTGFLGLRLIKKTVNFDDPNTYHLYYGDAVGTPGTILTFFPWEGMRRGQRGSGQTNNIAFSVPEGALGYWLDRLATRNLDCQRERLFGDDTLLFEDPDGLSLRLIAHKDAPDTVYWQQSNVPAEYAIRGVHSVTLWETHPEETEALLVEQLNYRKIAEENHVSRYEYAREPSQVGAKLDIRKTEGFWRGTPGAGTIHHIAFRAPDNEAQTTLRTSLKQRNLTPTPVIDRQYFHSVYFREPGGVLFEIATNTPGFLIDEPETTLGMNLKLPPQYETMRAQLQATLPTLHNPLVNTPAPPDNTRAPELEFVHRWVAHAGATRTLLLLHGTGGDEQDLLSVGRFLSDDASLLSPRGRVLEGAMPRFFRRVAEGVFDEENLKQEAAALATFIQNATRTYRVADTPVIAVGYSNGANIASATLLLHPHVLQGAILLRPMLPFELSDLPDLSGIPVFISTGTQDPLVSEDNITALIDVLTRAGATVTHHQENTGHALNKNELTVAKHWLTHLKTHA